MNQFVKACGWILTLCSFHSYVHAETEMLSVTVSPFKDLAIYPTATVAAEVVSLNDSRISAEVSGVIQGIPVSVGDVVEKGSELVRLDQANYTLARDQAKSVLDGIQANLELAKYQLGRAKKLVAQKAVSEELLKQRDAEYKALFAEREAQRAILKTTQQNLKKCSIRAPFKAVVMDRLANVGELATLGTPLLRIIDAEQIEIAAKLQVNDVLSIRNAKNIQFSTPYDIFDIEIKSITPAIDPIQRSQEVRFEFSDTQATSGSAGKVVWRNPEPHLATDYITRRNDVLGVFVLEGQYARFHILPTAQEGRPTLVNLSLDAEVIVDGRFGLINNQAVSTR